MSNTLDADIQMLDIDLLDPHPWNPRTWSETHESWVDEEKVEDLIMLINQCGYDLSQPILVRPSPNDPDRYQIIRGHQRTAAQKARKETQIPGVIRELDDTEAATKLVTDQGKSLDMWAIARHAWLMCKAWGAEGMMSVSEYAEKVVNRDQRTVSDWLGAVEVRLELEKTTAVAVLSEFSLRAARDFSSLDRSDWGWIAELAANEDWSADQRSAAVKAVKSIKIPDHFQCWLDPVEAKKDAVQVSIYFPNSTEPPQRRIQGLVAAAQKYLDKLGKRKVPKFKEHMPYWEEVDLQKMFLDRLPTVVEPSIQKVEGLWAAITGECDALDKKFDAWQNAQATEEEQQRAAEESERDRIATKLEYSPKAFPDLADAYEAFRDQSFSVVFTVSPEDTAFEDWLSWAADSLIPGGVLICLSWNEDSFDLYEAHKTYTLDLLDKLVWVRPDETATERFSFDHEDILVFAKPGTQPHELSGEGRKSDVISGIPLGRPDLLSIRLLELYSQPNDNILVAADFHKRREYAGKKEALGAFAIAAKRLGRKAAFVEGDSKLMVKLGSVVDDAPFSWEV